MQSIHPRYIIELLMQKLLSSYFLLFSSLLIIGSFLGCQESPQTKLNPTATQAVPATTTPKTNVRLPWAPSIDTSWVVALYKEADHFTLVRHTEEYQQFDLHHSAVVKVLTHLYRQDPAFHDRLRLLERNRQQFYLATRQGVIDDYKTYHSLEGMDFEYLCARQDSVIKVLILRLLKDKRATTDEKVYARKMLREHYSLSDR